MKERLTVIAVIAWSLACLGFFLIGEAYFDPSGEHGLAGQTWFVGLQWLALVGPIAGTFLANRILNHSLKNHDAQN
ncbi:MAG: hypothetical protein JHC57_11655 [Sphingopyxis sp.]|uniref:hypothetical protein n=1 Tax=Sphingopyxis sp. TaxID=1908224 RepID=UPI001A2727F0|nr:hypothetical protein [Sphingopyxis sp.]MBJ7500396.1 hypothetical protein [Sphingopyxis sp.]